MNMLLRTLSFAFVCALIAASCKPADDQNPSPAGLLSGYLISARQLDLDSPATKYTEQATAYFIMHPGESARTFVDSMRVNNIAMPLDVVAMSYNAAGGSGQALQMDLSCNWRVWSSGNVSAFTYNYTDPYPGYLTPLPDTIEQKNGFTIALPINKDSATIILGYGPQQMVKSFKGNTGTYAAADLASLSTGNITLQVTGYKMTTQAFGGKNFRFVKQTSKSKVVWLR